MNQQIEFRTKRDSRIQGGILLDNGDILCLCCGAIFPADEHEENEVEIIHIFYTWKDLSQEILMEW